MYSYAMIKGSLNYLVSCTKIIFVTAPEKQYHYPELFSHTISSGDKLYGMVFKPHDLQMGVKYPIILSVYGGPEVQLVSNTFKGKINNVLCGFNKNYAALMVILLVCFHKNPH